MADKSLITQEQLQSDLEQFYSQKIYPYLNGATHAGFTPVGSVIAIMGNEAPNHYLACDGTLYTIADYPQLTAYFEDQFGSINYFGGNGTTTFAVPDLRGEFLRGTGTNSHTDQGNGANVGVHQDGTANVYMLLENYTTPKLSFTGLISSSNPVNAPNSVDFLKKGTTDRIDITGTKTTVAEAYANRVYTSRPTNTSVLWCIAYENTYIDGSGESSGGGHKIQNEGDLEPLTQRKTMLLNEPLVASDDAEGGNTVVDVDTDVDLSVIKAPGTTGQVDGHIYSTDETVVGTWIDGKPVYERTLTFNTSATSDMVNVSLGFQLDNTIFFSGTITHNDNTNIQVPIPFSTTDSSLQAYECIFLLRGNNHPSLPNTLGYKAIGVYTHQKPVIITMRYTKATDTV